MNLVLVMAAMGLLALVLFFERRQRRTFYLPLKTVVSLLFIAAALVQPRPLTSYFHFLMAGLVCCLAGDVLLALPGQKAFRLGLVAFLLGHLAYVLAFVRFSSPRGVVFWAATVAVLAVSAFVFRWLEPFLGRMRGAVLAYVAAISTMLIAALAVAGNAGLAPSGRALVLLGAICFYLSDLFVARHRFVALGFANRLYGLPLYYIGQFLLAFSVGRIL
ncbi:MAG: lysoplasmalogenase [Desulfobacteraceae bacterium]|jgi:uncharacterized membrane protein YhhN|nr:lysoplasmalogenase [Desulfobacteraceae bacterium]